MPKILALFINPKVVSWQKPVQNLFWDIFQIQGLFYCRWRLSRLQASRACVWRCGETGPNYVLWYVYQHQRWLPHTADSDRECSGWDRRISIIALLRSRLRRADFALYFKLEADWFGFAILKAGLPDVALAKKWPARRSLGEVWWRGQDSNPDLKALSHLSYLLMCLLSIKLLLEMRLSLHVGPYAKLFIYLWTSLRFIPANWQ